MSAKPMVGPAMLLVSLFLSPPAHAEVTPYRFSLTPFAGYRIGGDFEADDDDELELDDGASIGLILNAPFDDRTEWEVLYSRQSTDIEYSTVTVDPDVDLTVEYLQIGGTYVGGGEIARPYLAATIGGSRIDPDSGGFDAETYFAFGIGGGLHVFPEDRIGLRLEGRLFGSLVDSDSGVFCQSGPNANRCLVRSSGDVFWQWEMFAGMTVRF